MNFQTTLAVLTLLLSLSTGRVCFADETQLAAEAVVRKLGASSFLERENASQQLILMGSKAESALVAAAKGADREIQDRAQRVLRLIREKSRAELLTVFQKAKPLDVDAEQVDAQSTVAKNAKKLPGWPEFVERFGDSDGSRKVYASILKAEWDLVADCFSAEDEFHRRNRMTRHSSEIRRRGVNSYNCEEGTALAMFYVYAQFPQSPGLRLHQSLFQYMRNPHVKERMTGSSQDKAARELVRELVGDWVIAASEPGLNDRNALTALQHARMAGLDKPSQVIAERVLKNKDSLPLTKRYAMESIVLRNDKSQVALIEPHLGDKTVLSTSKQKTRQLRDVALASVMYLKGYNLKAIGVKLRPRTSSNYAFDPQSLGYITEGDREKAFDAYRKFEELKAERK